MVKRIVRGRLEDILSAIEEIEDIVGDLDLGSYRESKTKRRAVERCLEIVSEAARHIPADSTLRHDEIPWGSIRGIGNILRHEYGDVDDVDDVVMWQTATKAIPDLKIVVTAMIVALKPDE
jgi:uncharacterized protein with HEPN domain